MTEAANFTSAQIQEYMKSMDEADQAVQDKLKAQAEKYFAEQSVRAAQIGKESAQIQASAPKGGGGGGK